MNYRTILPMLILSLSAQFIFGQTFLQADHIEIGLDDASGAYVSPILPPAGYHPTEPNNLGVVSDVRKKGWDPSSPFPPICGDYFAPGSPEEGFSLKANGVTYINSLFATGLGISGAITSVENGPGPRRYAVWEGSTGALNIRQTTVGFKNRQYVYTVVDLCNDDVTAVTGIYYGKNWDPDNEQAWSGDYLTTHGVVSQIPSDPYSEVESEGLLYGCYMSGVSADSRSRASYGGFATGDPADMWNEMPPYSHSGSNTADEANQMSFNIGTLNPGECTCLSMVYVFKETELVPARTALPIACSEVASMLADPLNYDLISRMDPTNPDLMQSLVNQPLVGVKVHPNPATNFAIVDLSNLEDVVNLRLVNISGQTVFQKLNVTTGGQQLIEVADLPPAIYALQIETATEVLVSKLVVQ